MSTKALEENFALLEASLAPGSYEEYRPELQTRLWQWIPEELLWNILLRLPVATQCRFRSVCKRWGAPFSASSPREVTRPTCTIMGNGVHSDDWFFCHQENKWYRFPMQPRVWRSVDEDGFVELGWVLVATAGGLLCYEDPYARGTDLLICNPMTGSHNRLCPNVIRPARLVVKGFFVDLESRTYQVVLMGHKATVVYDSKSKEWWASPNTLRGYPRSPVRSHEDVFAWKNFICVRELCSRTFQELDMITGEWRTLGDVHLPCDVQAPYHLGSWKDQVVLVQLRPKSDDPVHVWMLRDKEMDILDLSAPHWEKVPVEIPDSMRAVMYELEKCFLHGHEYVCFTTGWTHHWVKYTFQSKTWQYMPRRDKVDPTFAGSDRELVYKYDQYRWLIFEPQVHMDLLRCDSEDENQTVS